MIKRWFGAVLVVLATMAGCGGEDESEPQSAVATKTAGYALKMEVSLKSKNGKYAFLTPSNTTVEYGADFLVGKPYLIATFPAGFSPGNDPPLDYRWGTLTEDMTISFTTEAKYKDGPYDIVFVCYTHTPITEEIKAGPPQQSPAAAGGDIASFSLSTDEVRAGDPKNALGTLRLNVQGTDATVSIENRTPDDPKNAAQATASFNNTILTIP